MKTKTLAALALIAALGASPAWAAEVVSSNIVGYQKVSVPAGLTIIGQQFVAIGGAPASIQTIQADGLADGGMDSIQVWTGSDYEYYSYFSASDNIKGDDTAAWGDDNWEPVDETIAAGTGFWISASDNATITFAGEVGSVNTVTVPAGLSLVTPTLPADINIQSIQADGLADGGMDSIQVWNGSEYEYYSYFSASDNIKGDGTAAWGDDNWEPVDVTLYAGYGFWVSASGDSTLTFPTVSNN